MKSAYISPQVNVVLVSMADILTESPIITDEIPLL
jgi:hypothetical protein